MHETTYVTVKRLLEDAHYYLINIVQKEALERQLVSLIEEAVRLMETKKEVLIEKGGKRDETKRGNWVQNAVHHRTGSQ